MILPNTPKKINLEKTDYSALKNSYQWLQNTISGSVKPDDTLKSDRSRNFYPDVDRRKQSL